MSDKYIIGASFEAGICSYGFYTECDIPKLLERGQVLCDRCSDAEADVYHKPNTSHMHGYHVSRAVDSQKINSMECFTLPRNVDSIIGIRNGSLVFSCIRCSDLRVTMQHFLQLSDMEKELSNNNI